MEVNGKVLLKVLINHKLNLVNGVPGNKKILKFLGNSKLRSNLNNTEYKQLEELTYSLIEQRKKATKKEYIKIVEKNKKEYNDYMRGSFSEDFIEELESQRKIDIEKEKDGKDT